MFRIAQTLIFSFLVFASATMVSRSAKAQDESPIPDPPEPTEIERAEPDRATRDGFTVELGVGLALTEVNLADFAPAGSVVDDSIDVKFGIAPLSLALGWFVTQDAAVFLGTTGTSYFVDDSIVVNANFGVRGQYWLKKEIDLSLQIGVAVIGEDFFFSESEASTGLGTALRGGYALYSDGPHTIRVELELFASFVESAAVFAQALKLGYQFF